MEVALEIKPKNNVWIIDKAFYIPQLNRYRRIWLYLPPDYGTTKELYPVLYMQDGQNLFEDWSAFSEEWGVDETLNAVGGKCIVVGVDNGIEKRMNEYTLHDHERYGKAEGREYLSFIVKILKPYIDKTFRTKMERENTAIAGSSLGALISFYAALYYPETFGAAGIFSPAFWIDQRLKDEIKSKAEQNSQYAQHFYFYYGEKEGHEMKATTQPVIDLIKSFPHCSVKTVIKKEGTHAEAEWREQFPHFYQWINGKKEESTAAKSKRRKR